MRFRPPDADEQRRAIGPTEGLPEILRRAFAPGQDFEPVPAPGPGDWLAAHHEDGQSFEDFVRSRPRRPDAARGKLYFQPLGSFEEDRSPKLSSLRTYACAFFQLPVEVLASLPAEEVLQHARINPFTRRRQVLTDDVLGLLKKRLPEDAFCILAITTEDLYPEPSWNFVFGQASLSERAGVYSFARYDPAFFGEAEPPDLGKLVLRRSCEVLAHETVHMFGIHHCIHFNCMMNGSNHLDESDSRPMHLCPIDLRKLQHSIGFDVLERYRALKAFCEAAGFDEEARWLGRRLESLEP